MHSLEDFSSKVLKYRDTVVYFLSQELQLEGRAVYVNPCRADMKLSRVFAYQARHNDPAEGLTGEGYLNQYREGLPAVELE